VWKFGTHIATTIDKLQHLEYLKPPFLDTCEWAIRPVFPNTVTNLHAALKVPRGAGDRKQGIYNWWPKVAKYVFNFQLKKKNVITQYLILCNLP